MTRRQLLAAGTVASVATVLATACGSNDDAGPAGPTASSEVAASSSPTSSSSASPVMDDATMAMLDRIFAEQFAATGVAGLAGAVQIGDDEWVGSAGVADLSSGEAFRPADFMRIASVTKTFTATAVLQLVDKGLVSLDDVLERYVPGVINGDVATIADLLGMQSGIPDFTANARFLDAFTADPTMAWTERRTLDVIAEASEADFAPGARTAYCDSNFVLLGMVAEAVTGEPVGVTVTQSIIEPLGLTSTSYPTGAMVPDPHPTAYAPVLDPNDPGAPIDNVANPPRVVNDVNPAVAAGAGAMIST
ncbi:MAG: serine hydrolase domain-containing protein, partial [Ilumatobacteraceae bacterium]